MSSLTLTAEDIKASLKGIAGIIRYLYYIFLIPVPVALFWVVGREYGMSGSEPQVILGVVFSSQFSKIIDVAIKALGRSLIFIAPSIVSLLIANALSGIRTGISPKPKHLMLSVALAGLLIPLIGALPFILSNYLYPPDSTVSISLLDAFFESTSGWSATGFTMIQNPDAVGKDILFYRSITNWFGGLAIVAMALVVFMKKGTVASTYYGLDKGEVRMKPSIRGTINEAGKVYLVYTIICLILLYVAGMGVFDSVNHAMSAVSTGGFTTHGDGINHFSDKPLVQIILTLFMLVGSINLIMHLRIFEGRIGNLFHNIEFKYMTALLLISTIIVSGVLFYASAFTDLKTPAQAAFQTISALTTTGFSIVDLPNWPEVTQMMLIFLMLIGGFFGSAAGGIKLLRFVVIAETIAYSMKRLILPKTAILRVKIGNAPIEGTELLNAIGLSAAFALAAFIGVIILMLAGLTLTQSAFMSASAISNVGLINMPSADWFAINELAKVTLIILMWAGRIEIFPAMILVASFIAGKKI
jgi:trk system potassium uptake protein TrkH